VDNCPTVPNRDQANRDKDKYGDACDLDGCHSSCAVGCTKPADPTACTTPFYSSSSRECERCIPTWHPVQKGCAQGPPSPPNCPAVTGQCPAGTYVGGFSLKFRLNVTQY
jgi:hypothetical protein